MRAISTLAIVLFILSAAPARAQDTFGDLIQKIHAGQQVIVVDQQGARTKGRVDTLSPDTLVVNSGLPRTFTPSDVRQVLKPDHVWDGALKGAAFGLIPAVLIGVFDCDECVPGAIAVLFVGAGAGTGLAIDAIAGPKTVFRGHAPSSHVSVVPIVGHNRRGVSASIRF